MDAGAWALLFGIAFYLIIRRTPYDWLKAAGGLLIAVGLVSLAIDVLRLFR